jgi:hypothetical protein
MNINGLGVWGIGYDFSIAPKELRGADTEKKFGIEFRSPVYGVTGDDVRDYGEIQHALQVAKQVGCRVNHRCGIHVHVSTESLQFNIDRMGKSLKALPYRHANKYRAERYCFMPGDRIDNRHHLAVAVAKTSVYPYRHMEIRVFNGSLNTRHVYRSINFAIRLAKAELEIQAQKQKELQ